MIRSATYSTQDYFYQTRIKKKKKKNWSMFFLYYSCISLNIPFVHFTDEKIIKLV